jgi:membrane-bound lytic murein transglycosylase A
MIMRKTLGLALLTLTLSLSSVPASFAQRVLQPVDQQNSIVQDQSLGLDDQLWGDISKPGDKQALLQSIDNSLRYFNSIRAPREYKRYPIPGFTRDRVYRSLIRFRQLVVESENAQELQSAVKKEFNFYQSIGRDKQGTVLFTAYYQPIHEASRVRTEEFRYPIYKAPANFDRWRRPYPTRAQLEGRDGLGNGMLRGLEIAWLRDRLEAYLVQIEGSAILHFTDGTSVAIGYDGATDYPYISLGKELIKDNKVPAEGLTLPVLMKYFAQRPGELDNYIPRNNRFVFFRKKADFNAEGSLQVPLTTERSIATDKSLMPPGAIALIHFPMSYRNAEGKIEKKLVSRFVLDQDTGSAIKGAGRVDYFLGTGEEVGNRAGVIADNGHLYYLLLK